MSGDARLAAQLLAIAPQLGGLSLRGGGPVRDELLIGLRAHFPAGAQWRRLPLNIDQERLSGGIDLVASLAGGSPVRTRGILAEVAGGALIVPMAERLDTSIAGQVAQAIDSEPFILVLLDDGLELDEGPPPALLERVAFHVDLSGSSLEERTFRPIALAKVEAVNAEALETLASIAAAIGVGSVRALNFAALTARAHAALHRRKSVDTADLQAAARLVLAPRATQIPQIAENPPPPDHQPDSDRNSESLDETATSTPHDLVLASALAAIPDGMLEWVSARRSARRMRGGGQGVSGRSAIRGRPMGARPGMPRGGTRLALIDTLRAAVPWQTLRRAEQSGASSGILVRKDDLRIRRFKERSVALTIFCVDASGSAAVARLAEAKGAVERLLAQAYVKRSEVALIAFRGDGAEVLLPPTRSLTRARRTLAELPGGGGTPLASGIALAQQLGEQAITRGRTPLLVFLTDGSANICRDGQPGRSQAQADAEAAARGVAAGVIDALLIDIAPRPRASAEALANTMRARYLPLPAANAQGIEQAVSAAQRGPA